MTFPFPWAKEPGQTRKFAAQGAAIWQPYSVPLGANLLSIVVVGAGGAGGNGFTAAAAAARGGGGGGGSGAITRLLIPTVFLPQTLWCLVGIGGGTGGDSYVALSQSNIAQTMLARSTGGGLGGIGTGTAAGAAGAAAAATSLANQGPYGALGQYISLAGTAGVAGGGVNAVGVSYIVGTGGVFLSGGAGGAGVTAADLAGGAMIGAGLFPSIAGGLAGSNAGNPGFRGLLIPPTFSGGSGGGSSNTGVGGAGGAAGQGSGGGGGGGGTTGGIGGRGGDGIIFITALH